MERGRKVVRVDGDGFDDAVFDVDGDLLMGMRMKRRKEGGEKMEGRKSRKEGR